MRVRLSLPPSAQTRYASEEENSSPVPIAETARVDTADNSVFISVIIPTFEDTFRLRLTLEGLCRQTHRAFEVIVVNDGGSDETKTLCDEYSHRLDLNYEYLHPPKSSEEPGRTSAARNLGVKHSRGELLVFLDADCIADATMLEAHAAKYAPHHVTFGFRRHISEERAREITIPLDQKFLEEHSTPDRRLTFGMSSPWGTPNDGWIYFYGFSLGIPAHAIESLGGFDEGIVGWGTEDIELGLRLRFAGMDFFPLLGAMVTHIDHPTRRGHPTKPFQSVRETGKINPLRALTRNGGPLIRNPKK